MQCDHEGRGCFFESASNVKLLVAGLAYAVDLLVMNQFVTMQHLAIRNRVSRSAVSKVAKFWLGFPVNPSAEI